MAGTSKNMHRWAQRNLFGTELVVFWGEVYVRTAILYRSAIRCGRADNIRERARKQSFFCNPTKISARTIAIAKALEGAKLEIRISKSETRTALPKRKNESKRGKFRALLFEHLVIVSSFGFRVFPDSTVQSFFLVPKACPPWWVALGNAIVPAVLYLFSVFFR